MEKHQSGIKPESWLVAAGRDSKPGAPLNVPPIPASNFIIGREREYSRDDGTPTWEALEEVVGGLESGRAVAFASGMAAIASVFDQLSAGAVVVMPTDCYQGVAGLAAAGAEKQRWSVQRVVVDDTAGWIRSCGVADLIWLESPSNPLLTVADLEAVCAASRKPGAIVAVDSTLATPLNQQPLEFGATVSLQSATKFIGGHSDLLAGVATTRDEALWHALRKSRELTGATPGTFEPLLAVRGAKTLALRLQRAQQTAMILSERLEMHPLVTRVRYPGLPSHPTHATPKRYEEVSMSPKKDAQESADSTAATGKTSRGFTDEERAAIQERAQELKAEASRGSRAKKATGESAVLAKIAEMPGPDRAMAERLHAIIKARAPALLPKTWYGMPAYARDGKVICFFQSAQKFNTRYATLGFSDTANLDEGGMWPVAFALQGSDRRRRSKDQRAREESGELRRSPPLAPPGGIAVWLAIITLSGTRPRPLAWPAVGVIALGVAL